MTPTDILTNKTGLFLKLCIHIHKFILYTLSTTYVILPKYHIKLKFKRLLGYWVMAAWDKKHKILFNQKVAEMKYGPANDPQIQTI